MKLSLCIPTYNEEKNIHYALDSAYDIADEVVIVDGGSTDSTIEKAKSYGDKVKIFPVDNPPNFLTNKQRAIEYAKGEWILQLDADEAVSPQLGEEIKHVILTPSEVEREESPANAGSDIRRRSFANAQDDKVGFFIPRKNFFLTRFLMKGGVYPDYVLRLYKRDKASFDLKDVHENVRVNGEVGYLKNALLHYSDPNFSRYLQRWNKYTGFEADRLMKEKGKPGFGDFFNYFVIKPKMWFLMTYFRHKGFMDGFPGFVFSLFSAIRFWAIYVKWWHASKKVR